MIIDIVFHDQAPRLPYSQAAERSYKFCDGVHMGSVKQPSNIRNILGIHVRVFYSLALICALEVRCRHFLNSFSNCIFQRCWPLTRSFHTRRSCSGRAVYLRPNHLALRRLTTRGKRCASIFLIPNDKWRAGSYETRRSCFDARLTREPTVSRLRINQVNLKSTTGQTCRVPVPVIDFRGLALALKVSAKPYALC